MKQRKNVLEKNMVKAHIGQKCIAAMAVTMAVMIWQPAASPVREVGEKMDRF